MNRAEPMSAMARMLPITAYLLFAIFLVVTSLRGYSDTTTLWVTSAVVTFGICGASAAHLLGWRPALVFAGLALVIGWFAEQMGATYGWFFGEYSYTDALGPRLGAVPMVVPLMWFALCYIGYVVANLIVWHAPVDRSDHLGEQVVLSLLAALIVTAYDLGMDPYMVFVLKAWIMVKTDGAWFTETVQGFVGWVMVAFVIITAFRLLVRGRTLAPAGPFSRRHALVPVLLYVGMMVGQLFTGHPVEVRTVAFFAMGIPALCALAGWRYWRSVANDGALTGGPQDGQ
ncbi:MAG TPA: carotenoid biosynthesis protein [Pseudomonadales bacterium]|nr:carotenoid biosynthesis protein [Pseudomonadales bacterium]